MWTARALVVAAAILVIQTATEAAAYADARCSVFEIKATNDPKVKRTRGLPKVVGKLPPKLVKKLSRGAFAQWNVFEVVKPSPHVENLKVRRPVNVKLAAGKAVLMLRNVAQLRGKKPRVSLRVELLTPKGKQLQEMNTSLDVGDTLLVVDDGLKIRGGKYIFALRCKAK
jgi:hypothetical protein